MCFYSKQSKTAQELENRFKAKFKDVGKHKPNVFINGFENPKIPVILNTASHEIQLIEWGLIPSWAKDASIQKNTLNARVETLKEKPAFKDYYHNRCLVLADGFYEWQWKDAKGKMKQKYLITSKLDTQFAFAGIWAPWRNPETGEEKITVSILTTKANELMAEIHNHKQRMPVILEPANERKWVENQKLTSNFIDLNAIKMDEKLSLF